MPANNTTNRERLLRLIDGAPDAINEIKEEPMAKAAPEEAASSNIPQKALQETDSSAVSADKLKPENTKKILWDKDVLKIFKLIVLVALVFVCLHYAAEIIKTLKKEPSAAPGLGSEAVMADDPSGIGLRLVGVDWESPPVALLEDLKTGKTHFARPNDRINGGKVKQIEKNKVVLSVNGKNVELL